MTLRRRTPLKPGKPLKRYTRLNPIGRKARRERPALEVFRDTVRERAEGLCEVHADPIMCAHYGSEAHHICPADRDRGIHDPERGLWLCHWCHIHFVHKYPAISYEKGWLIAAGSDQ